MKKYEGRIVGILGAVIIHLIAGILFMLYQIGSLKTQSYDQFTIELVQEEELPLQKKLPELPVTSVEKILKGDQELLNIAKYLANKSDEKINPSDYIDKVKEELIESGKLGKDNYIDEAKKTRSLQGDEKPAFKNDSAKNAKKEIPPESQTMAANYQGPTRIYYDLKGRNHMYLPLPIYKCQGSGKVVLIIEVNQSGDVEKASVISSESTTADPCLVETAVNTALISRFNPDYSATKLQTGTLTYQYVAQ